MLRRLLIVGLSLSLIVGWAVAQEETDPVRVFYDISAPGDVYAYTLNADNTLTDLGQIGSLGENWAGMRDHYRVSDEIVLAYLATDTTSGLYHLSPAGMTRLDIPEELVSASVISRFDVSAFRYPYIALIPVISEDTTFESATDVTSPVIINVETTEVTVLPRTVDKFNGYYVVRFAADPTIVRYAFRENVNGGYTLDGFAVDGVAEYNLATDEDVLIYEADDTSEFAIFFPNPDGSFWLHDREDFAPAHLIDLDGNITEIVPFEDTFSAIYGSNRVTFPADCVDFTCVVTVAPLDSAEPFDVEMLPLGEFFGVFDLWPISDEISMMGMETATSGSAYMALASGSVNDFAFHFVRVAAGEDPELIGIVPNDLPQDGDSFTPDGRYALLFDDPNSTTLRFVDTYTNTDLYTSDSIAGGYSWGVFSNGFTFTTLDGTGTGNMTVVYHDETGNLQVGATIGEVIDILPDDRYALATLDSILIFDGNGQQIAEVPANGTPIISREAENFLLYVGQ